MAMDFTSAVDNHPRLAQALGRFVGNWASIEFCLEMLLSNMLRIPLSTAGDIWHNFVATRSKLEMMVRINNHTYQGPYKAWIGGLLDRAMALNSTRNSYVHGLWSWREEEGLFYLSRQSLPDAKAEKQRKDAEPFKIEQIESAVQDVRKLYEDFFDLDLRTHALHKPPNEVRGPLSPQ